eukprot:CAMPEP_0204262544 /NCGR_PEP_ID=MMETSP0468-20130131/7747_1 /ASSEMBLY_ACC=CAM_ASM_000383 /TAXON_ID=2969 /ORGANISM="Oxyrrhis marina" /LENGTH=440 /DNA_ID=CAMNT_0051237225 /DNA_START=49 /DNA_END=1368 /DNA_ORIENTATION=+
MRVAGIIVACVTAGFLSGPSVAVEKEDESGGSDAAMTPEQAERMEARWVAEGAGEPEQEMVRESQQEYRDAESEEKSFHLLDPKTAAPPLATAKLSRNKAMESATTMAEAYAKLLSESKAVPSGPVQGYDVNATARESSYGPKFINPYMLPLVTDAELKAEAHHTIKKAVKVFTLQQTPLIVNELKRRAIIYGKQEGLNASKVIAPIMTVESYKKTKKLLRAVAQAKCHRISTIAKLPTICDKDSVELFATLQKGRLNIWKNQAESVARTTSTRASSIMAFRATHKKTKAEMLPLAYRLMEKSFAAEYPKYQRQWANLQKSEYIHLDETKQRFFQKAAELMTKQIEEQTHTAFWGAPMRRADRRMERAARKVAHQVAFKKTEEYLTPKFIAAASHALPHALRTGVKLGIQPWDPRWTPAVEAVTGADPNKLGAVHKPKQW